MKKKIVKKKRVVKKKVTRKSQELKLGEPVTWEQWGKRFEKMKRRKPLEFNFIRRSNKGISGDPFSGVGNEETFSMVDHLRPHQLDLNRKHSDMLDAMRYATATPKAATRGELGAAPSHYSKGKYTPWEVIDDWKLDYYCGNAVKYICRHEHKGKPVEDIQKAIDCLIKKRDNMKKEMGL